MSIGDRIKLIRDGVSRDKFATQTGISKTALVNYEAGDRVPPSDYLLKILEQFPEVSPAWLLAGEGEMKRGAKPKLQLKTNEDFKNKVLNILDAIEVAETLNLCPVSDLTPKERTALIYSMLIYSEDLISTCEVQKHEIYSIVPLAFSIVKRYEEMKESTKLTDKGIWETNLGKLLDAVLYVFGRQEDN